MINQQFKTYWYFAIIFVNFWPSLIYSNKADKRDDESDWQINRRERKIANSDNKINAESIGQKNIFKQFSSK